MPQSIKVLSFDLDDTLWPCAPTILGAEKMLYQWLAQHVSVITEHYDIYQLREKRQAIPEHYPHLAYDISQLRIKSFELLASEFKLTDDWIQPAFDVFYQARQQVDLFDDVKPVLDELTKEFQLVSLTNGNADVVKTGVSHWFDFSLNSAQIGKLKSAPDIYYKVQKLTAIQACQMVHIGDDPLYDVSGAKAAGVYSIWLNRFNKAWVLESCRPDAEIESLFELPELLSQLSGKAGS